MDNVLKRKCLAEINDLSKKKEYTRFLVKAKTGTQIQKCARIMVEPYFNAYIVAFTSILEKYQLNIPFVTEELLEIKRNCKLLISNPKAKEISLGKFEFNEFTEKILVRSKFKVGKKSDIFTTTALNTVIELISQTKNNPVKVWRLYTSQGYILAKNIMDGAEMSESLSQGEKQKMIEEEEAVMGKMNNGLKKYYEYFKSTTIAEYYFNRKPQINYLKKEIMELNKRIVLLEIVKARS